MSALNDSPQNASPTPASTASTTFPSYRAYEDYVDGTIHQAPETLRDRQLWLAQLPVDGQATEWFNSLSEPQEDDRPLEDRIRGRHAYRCTTSDTLILERAGAKTDSVLCQVLIFSCWYGDYTSSVFPELDPIEWFIGVFGLALDVPLIVWDHIRGRFKGRRRLFDKFVPTPWHETCSVLDIGDFALVLLNPHSQTRPPTVLVIVPQALDMRLYDPRADRSGVPIAVGRPYYVLESHGPPSMGGTAPSDTIQTEDKFIEIRYLRNTIQKKTQPSDTRTVTGCLFACVEALFEIHLSRPPLLVPILASGGQGSTVPLKHYRWPSEKDYRGKSLPEGPVHLHTRDVWARLSSDIGAHRETLLQLPQFARVYLSSINDSQQISLAALTSRFEARLNRLQATSTEFNAYLSMYSAERSNEMAERSIQESKRVIILTALAFVFLPLSLASSIYGMNVQQINESGHSISAFIVTAVALCMITFAVWGAVAGLLSYRNRLEVASREQGRGPDSTLKLWIWRPRILWFGARRVPGRVWWFLIRNDFIPSALRWRVHEIRECKDGLVVGIYRVLRSRVSFVNRYIINADRQGRSTA